AALNASAEAVLADRAKSKAEVMHLRAVVASEKVQLVQLSLRQAQGASPQTTAEYMAGGGAFVGCLALLVFYAIDVKRRMEPQLKELSEPLAPQSPYQAPEWTRGDVAGDASAEEWQQRARAAQEAAARSKAASDALREAATVRLSDAQEQLSAATRRAEKAEAAAGKSAAEAKSSTETAATAHVAAQKAREEAEQFSEGATQVQQQLRELQERLVQIADAERISREEKNAAQAAAQHAQAALDRLQMQVDPAFIEAQNRRVEEAEESLGGIRQ
ncbi:unnamed protein product, partial [Polarella glacialis]